MENPTRSFAVRALVGSATLLSLTASLSCAKTEPPPKTAAAVVAPAPAPSPPPAAAPPITLIPADVARAAVVATMVAPTLNGALDSALALARTAMPLPLDAAAVREMALGELGIPPQVASSLDLGAPVSAAVVAFGHDEAVKAAFTFTVKAGVDVAKFLTALGNVVARRGPVYQIQTPRNGDGWFLPMGNIIVFADSELGLAQAANLALEARRPGKDDVSVVLHPDGIARAAGTDVKTAVERLLALVDERAETAGSKIGPEGRVQMREILGYAADIGTAELAIDLSPAKGVAFLTRLNPKVGSGLEAVTRNVATVPIDARLFGKSDAGLAVTSAYPARTLDQLRRQRARLPEKGGKDVKAAGQLLDALASGLTGTLSMLGRLQPGLSFEIAYPIKDAASAAKIQTALLATDRAALAALVRSEVTGAGMEMKVQRARQLSVGKVRAAFWNLTFAMPADTMGIIKKLIGPRGLDVYAAVVGGGVDGGGDRLVMTMGPNAKARLTAIASGKQEAAKGDVAEAIALQGGRSLYYYADLREVAALVGALGGKNADPRVHAVAAMLKTAIPIAGGVTGDAQGKALTIDLTLPPSCIAGLGGLVGGLMGAAGGPPPGTSSMLEPR